jgi:hypothetical protein
MLGIYEDAPVRKGEKGLVREADYEPRVVICSLLLSVWHT